MLPTDEQVTAFNQNPMIQRLINFPIWTISNDEKLPVDISDALDHGFDLRFCKLFSYKRSNGLMPLSYFNDDSRITYLNRAIRLDVQLTQAFILDIEPDYPQDRTQALLNLPIKYLEFSTHNGFHAIVDIPSDILNDPKYANLFKEVETRFGQEGKHSGVEVFFNRHFVTFTKRTINLPNKYSDPEFLKTAYQSERNFFNYLLTVNPKGGTTLHKSFNVVEKQPKDVTNKFLNEFENRTNYQTVLDKYDLTSNTNKEHPNGDPSQYDYGICIRIINLLIQYISMPKYINKTRFDIKKILGTPDKPNFTNITWIAYHFADIYLHQVFGENGKYHNLEPDRIETKYDTQRDGQSYIMYLCSVAVEWLKEHNGFMNYYVPSEDDYINDDNGHSTITPNHQFNG